MPSHRAPSQPFIEAVLTRPPASPARTSGSLLRQWAGPAIIVLAGAGMLWRSWGRWPDALIDFGRELYVAWQLTEGKTLYTDIAYFNGPLSPYLNALWFRLFGVSLRTLVLCNIAIVVGLTVLLYRLLEAIGDRLSAAIACLAFVLLFACGQLVYTGNYNFICPYSHELTHGVMLSAAGIACLLEYQRARRAAFLAMAGLLAGLALLTKAEVSLAMCTALLLGIGLTVWIEDPPLRRRWALWGAFVGPMCIAPLVAVSLLALSMPLAEAVRGALGTWRWVFSRNVLSVFLYRDSMGIDDVKASLQAIQAWVGYYALMFMPALLAGMRRPTREWVRVILMTGCALLSGGMAYYAYGLDLNNAMRPLPVLMMGVAGMSLLMAVKRRQDPQRARRFVMRLTMAVFSLVLLGKVILYSRLHHYGFALAMPATTLSILALVSWVPSMISRYGGWGGVFRVSGLTVIALTLGGYLYQEDAWFRAKRYPVGGGADAFLTIGDARGRGVKMALKVIAEHVGARQTLTVFPKGEMVNYLSRRSTSSPYMTFESLELTLFGEERILASLAAHPPDYIMVVHTFEKSETGVQFFGHDYGTRIFPWIRAHYRTQLMIGMPPLQMDQFWILFLSRSTEPITESERVPLRAMER